MKQHIKEIEFLGILLGIVASLLAIWSFFTPDKTDVSGVTVGDTNTGTIINGDNNIINQNIIENLSLDEIRRRAQLKFDEKKYEETTQLYLLDEAKEDPIAINNLGYMYFNGLGVEKNIDKAYDLLKQNVVMNEDNIEVISNYAIFLLNSQKEDYIKEGVWIASHEEISNYLALNDYDETYGKYSINQQWDISKEKYNDFINKYFVEECYYELLDASVPIVKNDFQDYHLVDQYYDDNPITGTSHLIGRYIVNIKKFPLDLEFMRIE